MPMSVDALRTFLLALPGVEEGPCYGTPGFRVKGKLLARLWEDGETLVLKVGGMDERDMLLETQPDLFFITDHYRNYPSVLVRLSAIEPAVLARRIEVSWRAVASKRLIAARDAAQSHWEG